MAFNTTANSVLRRASQDQVDDWEDVELTQSVGPFQLYLDRGSQAPPGGTKPLASYKRLYDNTA